MHACIYYINFACMFNFSHCRLHIAARCVHDECQLMHGKDSITSRKQEIGDYYTIAACMANSYSYIIINYYNENYIAIVNVKAITYIASYIKRIACQLRDNTILQDEAWPSSPALAINWLTYTDSSGNCYAKQ